MEKSIVSSQWGCHLVIVRWCAIVAVAPLHTLPLRVAFFVKKHTIQIHPGQTFVIYQPSPRSWEAVVICLVWISKGLSQIFFQFISLIHHCFFSRCASLSQVNIRICPQKMLNLEQAAYIAVPTAWSASH